MKTKAIDGKRLSLILWIIGFFLVWELAALFLSDVLHDPMAAKKLPYFHAVIAETFAHGDNILLQSALTALRAVEGFLIGAFVGFLLALLMDLFGVIERMALPYLLASQMIPILGLAPIIFGLVKDLDMSRVTIAAYMTFFPVSLSLLSGFKSVDGEQRMLMRSYASSKFQYYRKLAMPYSVPFLFNGLKIAAPMAMTASAFVDTLSTQNGIGSIIIVALYGGGTTGQFWPAVFAASILGILSYILVILAERIVERFIPRAPEEMVGGAA
jgi:NitT/TauT family transport system permease protein